MGPRGDAGPEVCPSRFFVDDSALFLPNSYFLSGFVQGIAGAEGSPGKDGLVGERVRLNPAICFVSNGTRMHIMGLCVSRETGVILVQKVLLVVLGS